MKLTALLLRLLAPITLILVGLATPGVAQDSRDGITLVLRPGMEQAQIEALRETLKATDRPVTLRYEALGDAPAAAAPPRPAPDASPNLWATFEAGLASRIASVPRIPELGRDFAARWRENANGDTGSVLARFAVALALALAVAAGVHRLAHQVASRRATGRSEDLLGRFGTAARRLIIDLLALGAFVLAARLLIQGWLLPAPDLARETASVLTRSVALVALYVVAGRFLLAPDPSGAPLLPLPHAAWHRRMLVAYATVGAALTATVALARRIGSDPVAFEGWFLLGATIITALKIWWFWESRHDVAAVISRSAEAEGPARASLRHALGLVVPYLFIAVAALIWVMGSIVAASPESAHWSEAAGVTQNAVVLLPIVAFGVHALTAAWMKRARLARPTPVRAASEAAIRAVLTGGVWVLGLAVIIRAWRLALIDAGALSAMMQLLKVSVALVAGWAIWRFLRAYFEAYLPKRRGPAALGDEDVEIPVATRIATVMPIVRDLALGAVIAITALVALSGLGVDIGPLLAGFGVIGLAISFGSQALVRDIVSGLFFMTDDAFRVGEYIDTGKLKGTVEKITLRSVQLRHQNGQVHTIPFGRLDAITNFSRDWATIKFVIRLDREADIEKARRAIKKVGQQLLEDPELGPDFIQPLKMQGVQEIADSALIVRCKFTVKPTRPSYIQREALKRIHRALGEAGVPFASNAVMVRSGTSPEAAHAAAAAAAGSFVPSEEPRAA